VANVADHVIMRDARALGPIAVHAGGGEVPAVVGAAVMARDDVICFKLYAGGFGAAVSAVVIIAAKYLEPDTTG
jgi:hypothetical protein